MEGIYKQQGITELFSIDLDLQNKNFGSSLVQGKTLSGQKDLIITHQTTSKKVVDFISSGSLTSSSTSTVSSLHCTESSTSLYSLKRVHSIESSQISSTDGDQKISVEIQEPSVEIQEPKVKKAKSGKDEIPLPNLEAIESSPPKKDDRPSPIKNISPSKLSRLNPHGNIIQRIGNTTFARVNDPNCKNFGKWLSIYASPRSKQTAGVYIIGHMNDQGEIDFNQHFYVGGTNSKNRMEGHLYEAVGPNGTKIGCIILNRALHKYGNLRQKNVIDCTGDPEATWDKEIELITKYIEERGGGPGWNIKKVRQGTPASKPKVELPPSQMNLRPRELKFNSRDNDKKS